jgi:hypothetical protein
MNGSKIVAAAIGLFGLFTLLAMLLGGGPPPAPTDGNPEPRCSPPGPCKPEPTTPPQIGL